MTKAEHKVYIGNSDIECLMSEEDRKEAKFVSHSVIYSDNIIRDMPQDWRGAGTSELDRQAVLDTAERLYNSFGGRYNVHIKIQESDDKPEIQAEQKDSVDLTII
ncbi:hypothetical protein J4402_05380 [Candidatus Pacearchaeota archaeon]|nr:hypothetical protein [Candidatus Pacearchaeota archaeon]